MPGRNDPCPCGSGKKYKKCCLKKDEEARQAQLAAERAARETAFAPLRPLDIGTKSISTAADASGELEVEQSMAGWTEADEELARLWEEFKAEKDYEGQIAIFKTALDEELLDDETAFEMLNVIYGVTAANDERDRFDALVAQLHQRLPDAYTSDAHFYLSWLISNALITGRLGTLPALVNELADLAGAHLDIVNQAFDQLAYYDQLAALAAGLRRAWPSVQDTAKFFQWAVGEFAENGMTYATLDYLEHATETGLAEIEALGLYFDCNYVNRVHVETGSFRERVVLDPASTNSRFLEDTSLAPEGSALFLAHLRGEADRRWTLDDFDLTQHQPREGESEPVVNQGRLNFCYLTIEFLGYLRREEGVSYAKGELARDQIETYILRRYEGELKGAGPSRAGKKNKSKARVPQSNSILLPDNATLDRYLADLVKLFNPRPHRLAALFEMIPAWLRFLETRELIDAEQHAQTLDELRPLAAGLVEFWQNFNSEPAPRLAAARWPARVAS